MSLRTPVGFEVEATSRPKLSVVIPCYNEEESLPRLLARVIPCLEAETKGAWELILVDDGSSDGTCELIRKAHAQDERVRGLSLSRNFGHQPALFAGLAYAAGAYVGVMDADLQDPPEVLAECFRKALAENLDLVYGRRQKRQGSWLLRIGYWAFYRLMRATADESWPLDAGDFSVFNRTVLHLMLGLPERVRVLRGMRSWVGLRQGLVAYDRPPRERGISKYNLIKLAGLALSSLMSFSSLPLRLASFVGLGMSLLSLVLVVFVLLNRFFPQFTLLGYYIGANRGTTTIVTLLLIISSLLFLCLGVLGEYMALLLREIKQRPVAIVRQRHGISHDPIATDWLMEVHFPHEHESARNQSISA